MERFPAERTVRSPTSTRSTSSSPPARSIAAAPPAFISIMSEVTLPAHLVKELNALTRSLLSAPASMFPRAIEPLPVCKSMIPVPNASRSSTLRSPCAVILNAPSATSADLTTRSSISLIRTEPASVVFKLKKLVNTSRSTEPPASASTSPPVMRELNSLSEEESMARDFPFKIALPDPAEPVPTLNASPASRERFPPVTFASMTSTAPPADSESEPEATRIC